MRKRFAALSFTVITTNAGMVANGSTMKKTELTVTSENSRIALKSAPIT